MNDKDTTELVVRLRGFLDRAIDDVMMWSRKFGEQERKTWCAESRVAELEALLDEERLEEIITDSIDLDWTPRTAARAIVRAMKGVSDE
jgi:hypothetical protein